MVVVQRIVDGLAVAAEADELCVLQHPQLVKLLLTKARRNQ